LDKYLKYLKISNICKSILKTDDSMLCSKIGIILDKYVLNDNNNIYALESFFEFVSGFNITNEQFDRYKKIVDRKI